jgi:adenine-specific DNA methylase
MQATFGRQAIPMMWDYCEANPFGDSVGSWNSVLECVLIPFETAQHVLPNGHTECASAAEHPLPNDIASAFITDPPYYDAIPYADLSDFFYVWLRRTLPASLMPLFAQELSPKRNECIVDEAKGKDRQYFEQMMAQAMAEGSRLLAPSGIGIVVFANKSTTGWETQLQAMIDAGWIVTGSWPIDTEMGSRLRAMDSAALASSVHLVCRPRENANGTATESVGEWRDVLDELPKRIHEWMPRLAAEGVVGADAIFACLGPALEVFSRYSRVEKANGEAAELREYLEHVWAVVSTEALSMIFRDADAAGLEPDARLTAMWLWTLGGAADKAASNGHETTDDESEESEDDGESTPKKSAKATGFTLEFDAARKIAQGLGADLEKSFSIVRVAGDKARLLPVAERTEYLFGKQSANGPSTSRKTKKAKQKTFFEDLNEAEVAEEGWGELKGPPPGSTVLDRLHQAMILFAAGRGELMKRFLVDDGVGQDARFWKLAQSLSALYPPGTDERRWVEGVLARKKGLGL